CGKWVEFPPQAPKFLQQMLICPQFGDPIMGGPPVENGEGTENGGWLTLPDANPVTPALLATYVDAWWPSALQPLRKPAMAPTLDLTVHFRSELPPEGLADQPVLVHNTSIALIDGMCDSDSKIFTADGTLLAQARQLQLVIPLT
ncbi:MAG: thioesterase family protein, partial [Thermoleophilaceae bacterium]|nr:thioesterase family protein [Thermoleophilaceae bacterium]